MLSHTEIGEGLLLSVLFLAFFFSLLVPSRDLLRRCAVIDWALTSVKDSAAQQAAVS